MFASRTSISGLAAVAALAFLAAGCSEGGGLGLGSPFSGAKETLMGKPAPTPDLPDRPKLVIPPPSAGLPVPGQSVAAAAPAQPQWSAATQDPNKQAQDTTAAKKDSPGWFSGLFGSEEKKTQ